MGYGNPTYRQQMFWSTHVNFGHRIQRYILKSFSVIYAKYDRYFGQIAENEAKRKTKRKTERAPGIAWLCAHRPAEQYNRTVTHPFELIPLDDCPPHVPAWSAHSDELMNWQWWWRWLTCMILCQKKEEKSELETRRSNKPRSEGGPSEPDYMT